MFQHYSKRAGKIVSLLVLIFSTSAFAEEMQLGVILGSLTGISGKYRLDNGRAIDGALAYTFDGRKGMSIHADYLIDPARRLNAGELTPLNLYYGLGARVSDITDGSDRGKARVGIRAPIGINYLTTNPNLELFGELVPVLDLAPSTDVHLNAGIGARFRF
ncbi:hypothetical protein [Pseudobdellovibrio exovorus]|uniref:Outer membrane protein beta-barrel domain-containing protein n=1 Tax=Pseudobdellovibrio exovorus JSS TaxID=1184267 RepID=M4V997_9BACT|nr:hypothetical protein [Pseudobdellovibrio exovorus]AGH95962.1 hypothetical protein A11Q_1746 [Pseudobdellovibrio exovorus JSS]